MAPRSKRSAAGPQEPAPAKVDALVAKPIAKPRTKATKAKEAKEAAAKKDVTLATRVKTTTPAPVPGTYD